MYNKKSVISQWLISYVLLLFIPIAISCTTLFILKEDVKEETILLNDMVLRPLKNSIDSDLLALKRVHTELVMGSSIKKTMASFKRNHAEGVVQACELWKEAKNLKNTDAIVGGIYVNFYSSDIALYTDYGVHDREMIDEIVFGKENVESIYEVVENNPSGAFCKLKAIVYGKQQDVFCYVRSFPLHVDDSQTNGFIAVLANMDHLKNGITDMIESAGSGFVILDENNKKLFEIGEVSEFDASKRANLMYDDRGKVVSFVELETVNWCGVAISGKSIFWARLRSTQTLIIISVCSSLIIGGIFVCFILKKNYAPIKKIVNQALASNNENATKENEYNYLENTLNYLKNTENMLESMVEKREDIIRNHFFISLLRGLATDKMRTEAKIEAGFMSAAFVICAFDVVNYKELFADEPNMSDAQRKETTEFIINNVMLETIGRFHKGYMIEDGENFVCIIALSPEREEPERDVLEALNIGNTAIEENFNLIMNIIVSNVCRCTEKLPEGYREVLDVLEYVRLTGSCGIVRCSGVFIDADYYYLPELERCLIGAIETGMADRANEVLEEMFSSEDQSNSLSGLKLKILTVELAKTLLKYAENDSERSSIVAICNQTNNCSKVKELAFSVVDGLCKKKASQVNRMAISIEEGVKEYIEQHYAETMLTIQEFGDYFGLSPYYVSRVFKNKTGIGVVEYLRQVRVNKAMEIMRENPIISFEDLAATVGLNGSRALTRAFKHEIGILPTEFRQRLGKEGS